MRNEHLVHLWLDASVIQAGERIMPVGVLQVAGSQPQQVFLGVA